MLFDFSGSVEFTGMRSWRLLQRASLSSLPGRDFWWFQVVTTGMIGMIKSNGGLFLFHMHFTWIDIFEADFCGELPSNSPVS